MRPPGGDSRSGGAGGGCGGEAGQRRAGDTLGVKGLSPEPGLGVQLLEVIFVKVSGDLPCTFDVCRCFHL